MAVAGLERLEFASLERVAIPDAIGSVTAPDGTYSGDVTHGDPCIPVHAAALSGSG